MSLTVGLFFPSVSWGTEVEEVEEVEGSDGEVVYIDDDEIDVPAFPGEISVDSTQVEA